MDIKEEIKILKDYTSKIDKHNNMEVYKTIQYNFLDGYIRIMLNMIDGNSNYEVYLYIKLDNEIASPLLYNEYNDIVNATEKFNKMVNLVKSQNLDTIRNIIKKVYKKVSKK